MNCRNKEVVLNFWMVLFRNFPGHPFPPQPTANAYRSTSS